MNGALSPSLTTGGSIEAKAQEILQETSWVAESQKGDALAFNRLVLKWERPVFNLALRMLQNEDEAADATQEVFLLAFKNIRQFRQEARFSTWLYRIAANHCITHLRQRPIETQVSLDDHQTETAIDSMMPVRESHEKDLLLEERRERVTRALGKLPPEQRIVVELKFFQDLTFEEIALIARTPLSTVKTRLYKGLETLKVHLGKAERRTKGGKGDEHVV